MEKEAPCAAPLAEASRLNREVTDTRETLLRCPGPHSERILFVVASLPSEPVSHEAYSR